uniref:C-type lectin domain-containing protein n=1 Tax=Amphilophus citrinellus TaxID=61819 RepID=A0A3Q0RP43_AMPCI
MAVQGVHPITARIASRLPVTQTGKAEEENKWMLNVQYHFINESLTWYEAQRFCRLKYTDLATINDMDDQNQLVNTLSSHVTSTWIGLYKGQSNRWLWSDGSGRAVFTKWGPTEPSNSGVPGIQIISTHDVKNSATASFEGPGPRCSRPTKSAKAGSERLAFISASPALTSA